MLVVEGIPLFLLELAVGQRLQLGALGSWSAISPLLGGIGLASMVVSFVVCLYYNVIVMWAILYFFHSFNPDLPWVDYECVDDPSLIPCRRVDNSTSDLDSHTFDTKNFWYHEVVFASGRIEDTGTVDYKPALCLLFSWIVVYFCCAKGIESSGKVVYFTATFPYLILIILFFRGVTLPGADEGIEFYLKPDFSRLADPEVWVSAAGQIFYSLGLGFGAVIAFASYNPKNNDCVRDAFTIALTNCFTSVFAGFAVFSVIGFMAHKQNKSVADVVDGGPGQFGTLEGVVTILVDMKVFPPSVPKYHITGGLCLISFLFSILFVCQAGQYYFELFDIYTGTLPLLVIGFFELVAVGWVYGVDRLIDDIKEMTGRKIGLYWWYMWKWVSPITVFVIFWANVAREAREETTYEPGTTDEDGNPKKLPFPPYCVFLGWFLALSSILCIPAMAWIRKPPGWAGKIKDSFGGLSWAAFIAELRPSTSSPISGHIIVEDLSNQIDKVESGINDDIEVCGHVTVENLSNQTDKVESGIDDDTEV
eukprot:UC4_evm2s166